MKTPDLGSIRVSNNRGRFCQNLTLYLPFTAAQAVKGRYKVSHYSAEWNFTLNPFGAVWDGGAITATHLGNGTHGGFFELGIDVSGCLFTIDSGFVWTAANGDELHLTADPARTSGCPIPGQPGALDVSITYLVDDGTGRFAGATGEVAIGEGPTIIPDGLNPEVLSELSLLAK